MPMEAESRVCIKRRLLLYFYLVSWLFPSILRSQVGAKLHQPLKCKGGKVAFGNSDVGTFSFAVTTGVDCNACFQEWAE